jgi:hypothetical protein
MSYVAKYTAVYLACPQNVGRSVFSVPIPPDTPSYDRIHHSLTEYTAPGANFAEYTARQISEASKKNNDSFPISLFEDFLNFCALAAPQHPCLACPLCLK